MKVMILSPRIWVLETLAEPTGCEGIKAGDCRRGQGHSFCVETYLALMVADGLNA